MRAVYRLTFAALSIVSVSAAAWADSLRCQTINGNTNCVGSNGVSCQTIDGRRTCVSGHGDVVQSVGGPSPGTAPEDAGDFKDVPAVQRWLQRHHVTVPSPSQPSDGGDND